MEQIPVRDIVAPTMAQTQRRPLVVRLTHWINFVVFVALVISGAAILLAHPRLYWGETGAFGSPALLELPLVLDVEQSGWGRSLHFLAAWICVVNGTIYVLWGLFRRHFRAQTVYTGLQRAAYLTVIFVIVPSMILTGLAMSPAFTSVAPLVVRIFGGHQSARTIHFLGMDVLVLFLLVHVGMVYVSGFKKQMRGMITGPVEAQL